jgi:hypothetical protein
MRKHPALLPILALAAFALIAFMLLTLPTKMIQGQDSTDTTVEQMDVVAFSSQYHLLSQVIGSGGGAASGGSYQLHDIIGPSVRGDSQGGAYHLSSGFSPATGIPTGTDGSTKIYLPLVSAR